MPWLLLPSCAVTHVRFLASPSKCGYESAPDKSQKFLDKIPKFDDVRIEMW